MNDAVAETLDDAVPAGADNVDHVRNDHTGREFRMMFAAARSHRQFRHAQGDQEAQSVLVSLAGHISAFIRISRSSLPSVSVLMADCTSIVTSSMQVYRDCGQTELSSNASGSVTRGTEHPIGSSVCLTPIMSLKIALDDSRGSQALRYRGSFDTREWYWYGVETGIHLGCRADRRVVLPCMAMLAWTMLPPKADLHWSRHTPKIDTAGQDSRTSGRRPSHWVCMDRVREQSRPVSSVDPEIDRFGSGHRGAELPRYRIVRTTVVVDHQDVHWLVSEVESRPRVACSTARKMARHLLSVLPLTRIRVRHDTRPACTVTVPSFN